MSAATASAADLEREEAELLAELDQALDNEERALLAELRELDGKHAVSRERGWFAAFFRWAWPIIEPSTGLVWGWHMDLLCAELEDVLEERTDKLLITIPPGFAKSISTSVMLPAANWLHDPGSRAMYISASDSVARRDSSRSRDIIRDADYAAMADAAALARGADTWTLKHGDDQKANFHNTRKGVRSCFAMGASMIGERGNIQVVDDPVDTKDVLHASIDTIRRLMREAWDVFSKKLATRLNPVGRRARILMMQRLDPEDPAGHILALNERLIAEGTETRETLGRPGREGWRVLCLPLRFEADHPWRHEADPRTTEGDLLCPAVVDERQARELEENLGWQAAAQLQQRPVRAQGGMLRRESIPRYQGDPLDRLERYDEIWISCDPAKKGNEGNDPHALHAYGFEGEHMDVLDRVNARMNYSEFKEAADAFVAKWGPHVARTGGRSVFEDTANAINYMDERKGKIPNVYAFSPTGDTPGKNTSKQDRATYIERKTAGSLLRVPASAVCPWAEPLLDVVCGFPHVPHDEDVDCLSQAIILRATRGLAEVVIVGGTPKNEGVSRHAARMRGMRGRR